MKLRQIRFILALTSLSVLIWIIGEFLIGELFNSLTVSIIWAAFCLVACCAYSLWKCPRNPDNEDIPPQNNPKGEKKNG